MSPQGHLQHTDIKGTPERIQREGASLGEDSKGSWGTPLSLPHWEDFTGLSPRRYTLFCYFILISFIYIFIHLLENLETLEPLL